MRCLTIASAALLVTAVASSTPLRRRHAERTLPSHATSSGGARFRKVQVDNDAEPQQRVPLTALFSSSSSPNISLAWETHMVGQWFASAALVISPQADDGLAYFTSGGDWHDAPYPFWLVSGSTTGGGSVVWNDTSISPGSVFGAEGDSSFAAFSGIDFSTYATYLSVFQASSSIPIWADYIPGPTDNVWETGPASVVSEDGSVVAAGATYVPQENPAGTKNALVIAAKTGFPSTTLLSDSWPNATGLEILRMSSDGSILLAIAAIQEADGSIHSSLVRVYNLSTAPATTIASLTTPYVYAACLSPSGEYLVLATTDSEDRIDTYLVGGGLLTQTANSSYPASLPGTFQYISACRATNSGQLMAVFALFWGDSMNQSAVASFTLPSTPVSGNLTPSWLWLSHPVDPSLQDTPFADAITSDGSVYAYISAGGEPLIPGGAIPPTLHLFYTSSAGGNGPFAEVTTIAPGNATSASLQAFDMATAADGSLFVFATGQDGHYNVGSYGGGSYAWSIVTAAE